MVQKNSLVVLLSCIVLVITTSGCAGFTNGTGSDGPTEYHGNASDYLLTANEVGEGWAVNRTREARVSPTGTESARVIELDKNGERVNIAVVVMQSPANASSFFEDQRATYEQREMEIVNQSLGNDSFSGSSRGATVVEARLSNVHIQVLGTVHLNRLKNIAKSQIKKIAEAK